MTNREITDAIEEFAPLSLQESWDNSGWQLGKPEAECTGVIVCVDVTPDIIEEAASKGCNLIVSHHPLIFRGVKQITGRDRDAYGKPFAKGYPSIPHIPRLTARQPESHGRWPAGSAWQIPKVSTPRVWESSASCHRHCPGGSSSNLSKKHSARRQSDAPGCRPTTGKSSGWACVEAPPRNSFRLPLPEARRHMSPPTAS